MSRRTTPEPTTAPAPAPTPAPAPMHCAQRGCLVPAENILDDLCPVCNHPLHLIVSNE